jgi:ABC-type dipeptide/oligopeptide/nickel transport system permease subunit
LSPSIASTELHVHGPEVERSSTPVRTLLTFAKRRPLGALGAVMILAMVLIGTVGPFVAPYDPDEIGVTKKYAVPSLSGHLLGGDQFGRDVLSRILYGARISLMVGVVASTAGTLVGGLMGLASGYWGGKTDAIIQRLVDILMSFPLIILALTLLTALNRSLGTVIVAISVPFIPYGARVVRASTLVLKESQYVEAAKASGCSDLRIIVRHIAPGCIAPYMVLATGLIGVAIITESALGFLGLSIPPPTPTLGGMLGEALTLLMFAPHVAIAPGVFITLAVFAFNILGDALRDALDPRLRGKT